MANPKKITEPFKWGWSAEFTQDMCPVRECIGQVIAIDFDEGKIIGRAIAHTFPLDCKKIKIIGYKYAGELAGNEPIPIGQKFRVKETGKIGILSGYYKHKLTSKDNIWINIDNGNIENFDKSEIEPYFPEDVKPKKKKCDCGWGVGQVRVKDPCPDCGGKIDFKRK